MELRQLRMFEKMAETLNFSEAARQMCVTQGTLSQNIKQLENEVGGPLFNRNTHSVSLTDIGVEMVEYARNILRMEDECSQRIRDLAQSRKGQLRVGATNSFVPMATEVIASFGKQYPNVRITMYQNTVKELITMLLNHELDIVLAFKDKDSRLRTKIDSYHLFYSRLSAIVKDTHSIADRKSVTLKEISKYDFVLPVHGIQSRGYLDEALRRQGISLNIRYEMNLAYSLFNLVRKSKMVTILCDTSVLQSTFTNLRVVPLDERGCRLDGCFNVRRGEYMKHSVSEFLKLCNEYVEMNSIKQ